MKSLRESFRAMKAADLFLTASTVQLIELLKIYINIYRKQCIKGEVSKVKIKVSLRYNQDKIVIE